MKRPQHTPFGFTCSHYIHHSLIQYFMGKNYGKNEGAWHKIVNPAELLQLLFEFKKMALRENLDHSSMDDDEIDVLGDDTLVASADTPSLYARRSLHKMFCQNKQTQVKLLQKITYKYNRDGSTYDVIFPFMDGIEQCADSRCLLCTSLADNENDLFRIASEHDECKAANKAQFVSTPFKDDAHDHQLFDENTLKFDHPPEVKKYVSKIVGEGLVCQICSRTLKTKASLKQHIINLHEKPKDPKKRGRPSKASYYNFAALTMYDDEEMDIKPRMSPRKTSLIPFDAMVPKPIKKSIYRKF